MQAHKEMTPLHLEAHIACSKLIKTNYERELNDYTRVLACITEDMEGYKTILSEIEWLVDNILALSKEIEEAQKWQR